MNYCPLKRAGRGMDCAGRCLTTCWLRGEGQLARGSSSLNEAHLGGKKAATVRGRLASGTTEITEAYPTGQGREGGDRVRRSNRIAGTGPARHLQISTDHGEGDARGLARLAVGGWFGIGYDDDRCTTEAGDWRPGGATGTDVSEVDTARGAAAAVRRAD